MTFQEIERLLMEVTYPCISFTIATNGAHVHYLQVHFHSPDTATGRREEQRGRKWMLSEHMVKSEIVQTAFKAVLTAVEHEARENFRYKGAAIFGPHLDVDYLAGSLVTEKRP